MMTTDLRKGEGRAKEKIGQQKCKTVVGVHRKRRYG
jgi:hypothetical protein